VHGGFEAAIAPGVVVGLELAGHHARVPSTDSSSTRNLRAESLQTLALRVDLFIELGAGRE
jgi:hypothetical protein